MNDTTRLDVHPDVDAFVTAVRARFADLGEEEREELLGGLEADVSELVAERGSGALGDPVAYAAELRAAAGLPPVRQARLLRRGGSLSTILDDVRGWWAGVASRPRVAPVWSVVAALQPAWWLVRAWVAAVLVCVALPGWYTYGLTWLPGLRREYAVAVLAVCVVGSVLVGLGRVWPGASRAGSRGTGARVVLLGLNAAAVLGLLVANEQLENAGWDRYSQGYMESQYRAPGLVNDQRPVCNIAAYDAAGRPLRGVQLFDQRGRALDVQCPGRDRRSVPWVLGDVARWNVFPLGESERPRGRSGVPGDVDGAAFPTPERRTVPAVTNPLVPVRTEAERVPGARSGQQGDGGRRDDGRSRERR